MSFPPITPKKLRPFTPLVSPFNRQKSISPPPDIDIGVNSTPLPSSSGMFLLIRNVLPPTNTGFAKPVDLVKKAISEITSTAEGKELADVSLSVIPGGRPQDAHCSSAYVELAQEIRLLDALPRSDLLTDWMIALRKARPLWEVVWAPQKKGKDRRMTVRFRVADSKEKIPAGAPEKIRVHLESQGHRTIGGYVSFHGLVDITLADTRSVDHILAAYSYLVPTLSKLPIPVSPPKFIPINNPFELSIGGLSNYEGLEDTIEKWLTYSYPLDKAARTSRLFQFHVSDDREHFIFTMDSWLSTLIVLKDADAFRTYFAHSPDLIPPKLLFESNSSGFTRRSTASTIDAGATVVNDSITELKRDLADFRKEQVENNSLVQRQVAAIHVNMENQTNAVALIGNQLQQFGFSLLAGREEMVIKNQISDLDSRLSFETIISRTTDDPVEEKTAKTNITNLLIELREQRQLLSQASNTTVGLIGPPPGSIIPNPPPTASIAPHNPSPIPSVTAPAVPTPTFTAPVVHAPTVTAPVVHAVSPPVVPARAALIRNFPPRVSVSTITDPIPSTPPSISRATRPTAPRLSLPISPTTPTPSSHFSFSTLTTPPPVVWQTNPSKRSNSEVHSLETEAKQPKRSKPLTRSSTSGSLPQNVPDAQSSADVDMNEVCTPSTKHSHVLTTAHADLGQRFVGGRRPLIALSSCSLIVHDYLCSVGQLGCVCYAKLLSRYPLSYSYRSKRMPMFILWIIVAIILLSLATGTAATPSSSGSLSFYALNTNGFVHPMKIDATNRAISYRNPDIVVITETKTNSAASSKMSTNDYQFFDERGVPVTGHHLYKWGAILGVKKGITVSQRVPINHPALIGRLIAVDIVIPLDSGHGFTHRIFAVYAPWDVHDTAQTTTFWSEVTKLCLNTPSSWTLLGDLNATVTQAERKSGGTDARTHFTNFLRLSKGSDLWSNYPDRSRFTDWTCKPRLSTDGGSIIDRIVTSSGSLLDSEILIGDGHHDYIPMTDHRAIIGRLNLKPPDRPGNAARCLYDLPTPILNNPRIKFPSPNEKHLFQVYRDEMDNNIKTAGLHDCRVTDHDSFNLLYNELTKITNDTAVHVFGRVKRKQRNIQKTITNPLIQQLNAHSRSIGGALRLESNPLYPASHAARRTHAISLREFSSGLATGTHATLRSYLIANRKTTNQKLYKERSNEVYAREKRYDSYRISNALAGGSTKRLVQAAEFIPLPMSINTIDGSGRLISDPDQVKSETRLYWKKLYGRQPVPVMEKPWLSTKSVVNVHDRVSTNPFLWPRLASLTDYRALIRKGNARPSPGPDGIEKWCIKSLSDYSLTPVLELHNYMTMNSCFPGDIKDMYLTMFHKRGLRTDLNNWRGLMISNFLANSPMTWLNYLLTPYIASNNILPDTQVATQQGVQTRDLTSFLAGLRTWANRHNTTVYALKRDQMKGFDYLAPEGFYDAIAAYGLPNAIVDIDKAAQTNTRVFIRTAHGLTDPIFVSGVAKQGGPISPLKSTLTTSLGHRFLDDLANETPGALTITTSSHDRLDPHLPDDNISLPIRMTEATDDSIIFACSVTALQTFCLAQERFQYAYGWLTNWLKTTAFVLSPTGTQPDTLSMPSITVEPGVSPLTITNHDVPLIPNEIEFLRVKIDNPTYRFHELRDFIEAFTFPKFIGPTPITLIRKIVMQSIASRARALLTLQPITDTDALKLDRLVAAKVHSLTGFPWIFNSEIATLPTALHGFDFPSIRRINASIAVDGLARDLNHHIPAYRNMALITLADWTCSINDCINPLEGIGILKDFSRRLPYHTIPAAWIIAQKEMSTMKPPLRLCSTDRSYLLQGDVSISHCLKIIKTHDLSCPSGSAAYSLRSAGFLLVKQLGSWSLSNHTIKFHPHKIADRPLPQKKLTTAARNNWDKITLALSHSDLSWFFYGTTDLLIPRLQRRLNAEQYIINLSQVCRFNPSPSNHNGNTWATDGSMTPASSGISDSKSITAAVTGPATLVLRVLDRNSSILQGEQMGLLAALVLADPSPQIYTDHLNSTMLIEDSRSAINLDRRLRGMNGRSYYRWILDLVSRKFATVTYTKAHTTDITLPASLNREADHYASSAQKHILSIPAAPIPTFFMDPYTFHREHDGWIESNIRYFVDHFAAKDVANRIALMPKHRMSTWLYDPTPPPPWIYTKAPSAYTALVQLYARSGQLASAEGMFQKKAAISQLCRFGCPATENPHHIFVDCEHYSELRTSALTAVMSSVQKRLVEAEVDICHQNSVMNTVKYIFSDSKDVWPLQSSAFFLGQIPKIEPLLSPCAMTSSVDRSRLIHIIANDLHLSSTRLASRIYGDFQKEMTRRHVLIHGKRN
jgi:Reverse transcriptase (RNA-dependent DNA polymerase)